MSLKKQILTFEFDGTSFPNETPESTLNLVRLVASLRSKLHALVDAEGVSYVSTHITQLSETEDYYDARAKVFRKARDVVFTRLRKDDGISHPSWHTLHNAWYQWAGDFNTHARYKQDEAARLQRNKEEMDNFDREFPNAQSSRGTEAERLARHYLVRAHRASTDSLRFNHYTVMSGFMADYFTKDFPCVCYVYSKDGAQYLGIQYGLEEKAFIERML